MKYSGQFLNRQRKLGDQAADLLVTDAFSNGEQASLYALLKLEAREIREQSASPIKQFLESQKTNPDWFDARRLQKGQQLFKQYALEIMALLGTMSLPYCYAASPGNKALYLSDKMRNTPGKRLLDTASFVIDVLTPGSLGDSNIGHMHINKVRLIHALSRYHLKKQPHWNTAWGQPINQEDMAGTNLAFSYVILLGMQQSGFRLSQKEKEDFLFTWRYIGYLLNIHEGLLPASLAEARLLAGVIQKRNFKKTAEGATLTAELLKYFKACIPPWQAALVEPQVRYYLGHEIAEYIGLSPDPVKDWLTSFLLAFKSLQNMLTVKPESYLNMLSQHVILKSSIHSESVRVNR